jgi:hypothetical protein
MPALNGLPQPYQPSPYGCPDRPAQHRTRKHPALAARLCRDGTLATELPAGFDKFVEFRLVIKHKDNAKLSVSKPGPKAIVGG